VALSELAPAGSVDGDFKSFRLAFRKPGWLPRRLAVRRCRSPAQRSRRAELRIARAGLFATLKPVILTLTMNPAIDRNVSVDRLAFEDRGYICSTETSAGGRGINASSVLHSFGARTLAICTAGGKNGERFRRHLDACEFPYEAVPIEGEIRTNLNLTDRQGLTIKLNERGPLMNEDEVQRVVQAVASHLPDSSWLLVCGSLPPGVSGKIYAELVAHGHEAGVHVLLDADGEELREGLEAEPMLVTPNQREAEIFCTPR
jgi:1-phosphofructokinase family hexose kinase